MNKLDPAHTAVLAMDFQTDIISRLGDRGPAIVERAASLVAAARAAHAQVIYIVVGFRPGYPEVSPNNSNFATIAQSGKFTAPPGADIAAAIAPAAGDVIVQKHRVGAFLGTDLDQILRAQRIETLVLAGLSTSGVVRSTTRYAADADYKLVIAADACADPDDEVHRVLIEKVLVRQATVCTTADAIAALS